MTINVHASGAWKLASKFSVKVAGTWKDASAVFVKVAGVWQLAFGASGGGGSTLADAQQNATVVGSRSEAGSVTSSAAVALPTGGTAPYTHAWTRVSGDIFTINTPTAVNTTFTTTLSSGQTKSGVYRHTVTDSAGVPATAHADVTVNMTSSPAPALDVTMVPNSQLITRTDGTGGSSSVCSAGFSVSINNHGVPGSLVYSWVCGGSATITSGQGTPSATVSKSVSNQENSFTNVNCSVTDTNYQSRANGDGNSNAIHWISA